MIDLFVTCLHTRVCTLRWRAFVLGVALLAFVLAFGVRGQAQQPGASFQDGLAKMEAGQVNEAVAIWAGLAEQGQLEALYALGLVFESGAPGIVPDAMLAADYYRRAADGGLAEAQTNLGLLYAEGRGVAESQDKAVALWLEAAKKNNAIAQFNLGLAYFSGRGIEQDVPEALGLILVAALQGLPQAHYAIGQFYLRGLGLEEDRSLALAFLQQAKLGGHAAAEPFVSELLSEGVLEADLNDAAVQAALPSLPRLLAKRAIPDDSPGDRNESQVAQSNSGLAGNAQEAVTVPRLPLEGQGVPQTPTAPAPQAQATGGTPSAPAPLPLTSDPAQDPAAGPPQEGRAVVTVPSDSSTKSESAFSTFDGSPPLIDPSLLSKGALNVGGLRLGQVDADLLKPDPNLKLGSPAVPVPKGGFDLPLTLDDEQYANNLSGNVLGGNALGGNLAALDAKQTGGQTGGNAGAQASATPLRIQPGSPLLNSPNAVATLDDNEDAPAPLPLDNQQTAPVQIPQVSQMQSGQAGQRFGPLRSAVPSVQQAGVQQPGAPQPSVQQPGVNIASPQTGSQGPQVAARAPAANASFQQTPEGLMMLVGPKPQGVPFVLWVGTAKTSQEGAELWLAALQAEPSILNGLEAILEPVTVGKVKAFRVLVGPIPDERLGWQVCNAVKAGKMTFFCKVRPF